MSYIQTKLSLTKQQKSKLAQAYQTHGSVSIRLSNKALQGETPVLLTQTQINKVAKSIETGKGVQINFSVKQIQANATTGDGFFGDILKGVVGKVADVGIDLASDAAKSIVTSGGKAIVKGITGGTIYKLTPQDLHGAGILSDIGKKILGTVADVAIDAGGDLLKSGAKGLVKKVTGTGARKNKRVTANGIYAPGGH